MYYYSLAEYREELTHKDTESLIDELEKTVMTLSKDKYKEDDLNMDMLKYQTVRKEIYNRLKSYTGSQY